jgi:hypothetical protein
MSDTQTSENTETKLTFGQKLGNFIGAVAPALGPIGAIGGAILQNRTNKKLAQYSFNKNVEMWKMQNAYNSPKQQMARYNEAGLNPNLMYGKGTPGNAQTMPQYQALPSSGDVFGQSVAGLQGLVGIQQKKEELGITRIAREIAEATKGFKIEQASAEAESAVYNATTARYQSMIKNVEYWQKELGFDNADTTIKAILQSILREQMWNDIGMAMPDTEEYLFNVLKGVSITKDIAGAVTSLGLGAVLGRLSKNNTKTFKPSGYSKTSKNFYPKGKGTTLNDYYRAPGQ